MNYDSLRYYSCSLFLVDAEFSCLVLVMRSQVWHFVNDWAGGIVGMQVFRVGIVLEVRKGL